ncbi:13799_t:CDS:1 [Acaulospora colombiana]|uniref:13799_t:CDS:1 n=1 Tax=Acaulospora colombiana TaxID=27376 RepID=A0ACA9M544_9GLOM|nr:13799_t:CDS:1 [Acaulospora colombiana]
MTTTDPISPSYDTPIPTSYVQRLSAPVTSSNNTAKCPECHQLTSTIYWNWCQQCSARHFSANFANWSSNNSNLDKLIQEIQLNATYSEQVIEWIPYERFQNIRHISKGGFGEVMYAEWEDGQIYNWDISMGTWKRRGRHPVALKKLKGSEECPEDFLKEVRLVAFHLRITIKNNKFDEMLTFSSNTRLSLFTQ